MKKNRFIIGGAVLAAAGIALVMCGCRKIPHGVTAVKPFDSKKYLGLWYEIARFDFRFEKHLTNVTAHYSLNDDGSIKVVNRGYDTEEDQWKESVGRAKFVNSPNEGMLKVSFFGPFYSGYNVIAIDPDYKYALVVGDKRKYLWILSRERTIPMEVWQEYLNKAAGLGFDIEQLVMTEQVGK